MDDLSSTGWTWQPPRSDTYKLYRYIISRQVPREGSLPPGREQGGKCEYRIELEYYGTFQRQLKATEMYLHIYLLIVIKQPYYNTRVVVVMCYWELQRASARSSRNQLFPQVKLHVSPNSSFNTVITDSQQLNCLPWRFFVQLRIHQAISLSPSTSRAPQPHSTMARQCYITTAKSANSLSWSAT